MSISPALISNYLAFLGNGYIVDCIKRFDVHGKKIFETNEKYYFEDIGLRNALVGTNLLRDIEKLFENVVYLHLCNNGYRVMVGQLQNGGIDFIAQRNEEKYMYRYAIYSQRKRQ